MPRTEPPANGSIIFPLGGQNQWYNVSHRTGSKIEVHGILGNFLEKNSEKPRRFSFRPSPDCKKLFQIFLRFLQLPDRVSRTEKGGTMNNSESEPREEVPPPSRIRSRRSA